MALRANKARIITPEEEPRLYATVERVAKMAGIQTPEVGVVESYTPNAFATGRGPSDAAVVATRGLLNVLNDEELEGVIAHEMAHVKNRDILVMSIASMIASVISSVSQMIYWAAIFSSNDRDNGAAALVGIVASVLFPFAAMVIQLGISRNREYLADKTGAEFTGNPLGLANALRTISNPLGSSASSQRHDYTLDDQMSRTRTSSKRQQGDPFDTRQNSPGDIYDCAHMWISSPLKKGFFANLFSTHPPMEERIARLEEMARKQ